MFKFHLWVNGSEKSVFLSPPPRQVHKWKCQEIQALCIALQFWQYLKTVIWSWWGEIVKVILWHGHNNYDSSKMVAKCVILSDMIPQCKCFHFIPGKQKEAPLLQMHSSD